MKIGSRDFGIGKQTYIVGILNVTPDSFSDGGSHFTLESALRHARKMAADGADIIEIGGESTRPGATLVSADEELTRILPVIRLLKKELDIPVSIDTMKALTAQEALKAGAGMINDVSGLRHDPALAAVCAQYGAPLCIMHSREQMEDTVYENLLEDVTSELSQGIQVALENGIKQTNIIIDPGVGFSKTGEQNLEILHGLDFFSRLSCPVMLGTSRKRFIGSVLGGLPTGDRLEGTLATTVIGIMKGCDFIRVHDVKENKRVAVMTDAVMRSSAPTLR